MSLCFVSLWARVHLVEFPRMSLQKTWRPDLQKPTKYNFIETIRSFTVKAVIMLHVLEQSWTNDADSNINNNNKTNNSGTSLVMGLVQLSCHGWHFQLDLVRIILSWLPIMWTSSGFAQTAALSWVFWPTNDDESQHVKETFHLWGHWRGAGAQELSSGD